MADYDKSAHDMMRFRAGKYSEFERGRFLVAYHEDQLYSVRDEKRGTVTLVEARNPESAYLKASSIRPISSTDVRPVVHGRWEIASDPRFRHCSVCHDKVVFNMKNYPNFCDVCGADMRPVKNGQIGEKNSG